MLASDVEAEKTLILENMAEIGAKYEAMLAMDYRYDPNQPANDVVRAAVAEMVFERYGTFARQMMVRVMGREGNLDDAIYLSVLLDSTDKPKFNYPFKNFAVYGGKAHASDSDEKVREAAIEAVGKIIERGANIKGAAPVNGNLGKALVRCALLDESEKVREIAAEILWNNADKAVILMLIGEMKEAEAAGNMHIYVRAEDAAKKSVEAMGKVRVRGTALGPLIDAALEDGKTGMVASDIIVRLSGIEGEVAALIKKRRAAVSTSNGLSDDERARKVRRLTALIGRVGIASGNEEIPTPQQLRGAPGEKPTRNMRLMTVMAEKEDGPIHVPGDPIGNWLRRRAYRKEQKMIERMRAQERKVRINGKK